MSSKTIRCRFIATLVILNFYLVTSSVDSVVAQNFYDPSLETRDVIVDVQADYGANGLGNRDDSNRFQSAINFVSSQGGGVVTVPQGSYQIRNVDLKSNVHVEIDANAVLSPLLPPTNRINVLFRLGNSALAENVSIRGIGGSFNVEIPPAASRTMVFSLLNVRNFYIANVDIQDSLSVFSSFSMHPGLRTANDTGIPTRGTIENARTFGAHFGYGLIQVQAADSVNFRNLYGEGGVTLRLESGWARLNDWQPNGVGIFDIVGDNIVSEDGNAAVMLSPHAMFNGEVHINNILSLGSGFAARLGGGFVSRRYTNPNLVPGEFAASSLTNIRAVYGTNAQIRRDHIRFVPDELVGLVQDLADSEDGGESVRGPSAAPVLFQPNYDVSLVNLSQEGFEFSPRVVPEEAFQFNPLLGDCNLDGVVNFADIAPFTRLLSRGTFLEEADCNRDGVVDSLDVRPFIEILSRS